MRGKVPLSQDGLRVVSLGNFYCWPQRESCRGALFCSGLSLYLSSWLGRFCAEGRDRRVRPWQGQQRGLDFSVRRAKGVPAALLLLPGLLLFWWGRLLHFLTHCSLFLHLSCCCLPLLPCVVSLVYITPAPCFVWGTSPAQNVTPHLCPEGHDVTDLQVHTLSFFYLACLSISEEPRNAQTRTQHLPLQAYFTSFTSHVVIVFTGRVACHS